MNPGGAKKLVLDMLAEAGRAGRPCPTNNDLADRLGEVQDNHISSVVRRLQDDGLIRVQFLGCRRVIEAADGSWRTAPTAALHVKRRAGATRKCLTCRDPFVPEDRFDFCCDPCGERNAKVAMV